MGIRSGLNAASSCILPHMDLRHFLWFCKNLNSSVSFVSDSNRIHDSILIILLSVTAVCEGVL